MKASFKDSERELSTELCCIASLLQFKKYLNRLTAKLNYESRYVA